MMVIPTLHFCGRCKDAINLYQKAFHCNVKSIMHYDDAVQRGWEQDIPEKRNYIYHSEVYFGNQLFRMSDGVGTECNTNTCMGSIMDEFGIRWRLMNE
jgi:PhnB protein